MELEKGGSNGLASERDGAAELFARHSAPIYRYCLRRLGSREEAEDALQATYLNAWRSLKGGFAPDNPRPWLFAIAANVCTSTLRTKLGGTQLELRDPEAFDLVQVEQPEREAFLDLTEAVRELPDRQRHALFLRDWHGLPYDEIATRMAVSQAAVETLLVRARGRVATTLTSREWRRDLAASARALVLWPLSLIRENSALAGSSAQLKAGLLAGGTVAPLVAFGVLQATVFGSPERKDANRGTVAGPGLVAQVMPSASHLDRPRQEPSGHVRTEEPKRRPRPSSGAQAQTDSGAPAASGQLGGHAPGQGPGHGSGQEPGQGSGQGPEPAPPSEPAPSQSDGKVTLCHQTKHGGVTITVSEQAAAHGHSDDPRGACP